MPVIVGNTTVNTSITSSNVTVMSPQSWLYATSNRNSVRADLQLDFARSQVFDPRITFSRASSATYVNNLGIVSTAATNVPRIDYNPTTLACNGYLAELNSTNLLTYSAAIGGTNWTTTSTAPTITLNAATAPDNTTTASLYVPGTSTGYYDAVQTPANLTDNTYYSLSVWVKLSGAFFSIIHLQIGNNSVANSGNINAWIQVTGAGSVLSTSNTGTASNTSATVTAYPNGWYRCTVTGIPSVGATVTSSFVTIRPSLANGDNNMASGGDGTSGYYFWGAQLEASSVPTSYIPTTSSTATRSVDNSYINIQQFLLPYKASNGFPATFTVLFSFIFGTVFALQDGIGKHILVLSDTYVQSNGFRLYRQGTGTTNSIMLAGLGSESGNIISALPSGSYSTGSQIQVAVSFDGTNFYSTFTGSNVASGTLTGTLTNPISFLTIGGLSQPLNGWIRNVKFWPTCLSTTEIQTLMQG
jgi:hypothetical protein